MWRLLAGLYKYLCTGEILAETRHKIHMYPVGGGGGGGWGVVLPSFCQAWWRACHGICILHTPARYTDKAFVLSSVSKDLLNHVVTGSGIGMERGGGCIMKDWRRDTDLRNGDTDSRAEEWEHWFKGLRNGDTDLRGWGMGTLILGVEEWGHWS